MPGPAPPGPALVEPHAVCRRPELLQMVPELNDPELYRGASAMPLMMHAVGRRVSRAGEGAWNALYRSLLSATGHASTLENLDPRVDELVKVMVQDMSPRAD